TGEHDAENYRQALESIQSIDLTPLLERHYDRVSRSEGYGEMDIDVAWEPIDSPTEKEGAEINLAKAQEATMLYQTGAIDAEDIRDRLSMDDMSGYFGLEDKELDGEGALKDIDIDLAEFMDGDESKSE